jgi:hypothetical protein
LQKTTRRGKSKSLLLSEPELTSEQVSAKLDEIMEMERRMINEGADHDSIVKAIVAKFAESGLKKEVTEERFWSAIKLYVIPFDTYKQLILFFYQQQYVWRFSGMHCSSFVL